MTLGGLPRRAGAEEIALPAWRGRRELRRKTSRLLRPWKNLGRAREGALPRSKRLSFLLLPSLGEDSDRARGFVRELVFFGGKSDGMGRRLGAGCSVSLSGKDLTLISPTL
jgi:hypothetical protein